MNFEKKSAEIIVELESGVKQKLTLLYTYSGRELICLEQFNIYTGAWDTITERGFYALYWNFWSKEVREENIG